MHIRRAHRRFLAAFAVLVIAFAAFAPALANAFGGASPVMWVELCSAQGVKRVALAADGEPINTADHALLMEAHCPFCHLEHVPTTLAPVAPTVAPQPIERAEFPALFYAAPSQLFAWAPALARGPPAAS